MADAKISELSSAATLSGAEKIPGVQSGSNVAITTNQVATYIKSLAGATVAGRLARYTDTAGSQGQTSGIFEDASGNVGIGTTSPDSNLSVSGGNTQLHVSGGGTSYVQIDGGSVSQAAGVSFGYRGGSNQFGIGYNGSAANTLGFFTGANLSSGGTPSMVMNSSGNVGIGTTTPASKLEVAGQIAAAGGSAGAAGLSFAGDLDTGFYEIAANRIGVTAGGNVLWDIDGASKTSTLIGSTTTASYGQAPFTISDIAETFRLAMYANATTEKAGIQVWKSGVGTNYPLLLQEAGGNVGIGTTSPVCKADIDGPVRCKAYTVATVPSAAAGDAQMIYVTNPTVGSARPYWSQSSNWYDAAGTLLA